MNDREIYKEIRELQKFKYRDPIARVLGTALMRMCAKEALSGEIQDTLLTHALSASTPNEMSLRIREFII